MFIEVLRGPGAVHEVVPEAVDVFEAGPQRLAVVAAEEHPAVDPGAREIAPGLAVLEDLSLVAFEADIPVIRMVPELDVPPIGGILLADRSPAALAIDLIKAARAGVGFLALAAVEEPELRLVLPGRVVKLPCDSCREVTTKKKPTRPERQLLGFVELLISLPAGREIWIERALAGGTFADEGVVDCHAPLLRART